MSISVTHALIKGKRNGRMRIHGIASAQLHRRVSALFGSKREVQAAAGRPSGHDARA